jgi:hypothetical protein
MQRPMSLNPSTQHNVRSVCDAHFSMDDSSFASQTDAWDKLMEQVEHANFLLTSLPIPRLHPQLRKKYPEYIETEEHIKFLKFYATKHFYSRLNRVRRGFKGSPAVSQASDGEQVSNLGAISLC